VRQGPEKYSKENVDRAVRYILDQAAAGKTVSYEVALENIVNGRSPE
jgi:hypothetical protein